MELTIEQLEAWFEILKDNGVDEFECSAFRVKFASNYTPAHSAVQEMPREKPIVKSNWENPVLWGSGGPPKFPGSK